MPTSIAVVPAQPVADNYGPDALNLFPVYNRASYIKAFGVDPPTYDANKPTKGWFDTSGRMSEFGYYQNLGGAVNFVPIDLHGLGVGEVNLYGDHKYPSYEIAPTAATRMGGLIPKEYLCDVKAANELAWELGVKDSVTVEEEGDSLYSVTYPPEESRRICTIAFKGAQLNAGVLLGWKNYEGVGAPGHWDIAGAQPTWVTDVPPGLPILNPEIPVPQRKLMDNEKVNVTPFGFTIYKLGVGSPLETGPGTVTSGGFTAEDREILKQIHTSVTGTPVAAKTGKK